jgi:hypothetical protein
MNARGDSGRDGRNKVFPPERLGSMGEGEAPPASVDSCAEQLASCPQREVLAEWVDYHSEFSRGTPRAMLVLRSGARAGAHGFSGLDSGG